MYLVQSNAYELKVRSNDRNIMVGKVTRRWQKFPNFIEYANDRMTFQHKTEETAENAWRLACRPIQFYQRSYTYIGSQTRLSYFKKPISPPTSFFFSDTWKPDNVWEVLATHQGKFNLLLDGIIRGHVEAVHIQWLQEHSGHLQIYPMWQNLPRELPLDLLPGGQHYYEGVAALDPLDGLYRELQEFLRLGGEGRLRNCPGCRRYFVQSTARPLTYCDTKCRLKGDPNRRKANAEYQSRHREKLISKDIEKVKEAKARLRAQGKTNLALGWVLDEAKISSRRWISLRQYEVEHYGRTRDTDLTRP